MSHPPLPVWLRPYGVGWMLTLHVQPGAARTEAVGLHGEALKVRLAAPPVDGRANACLLAWLADRLGVAKSLVELHSGTASRRKTVVVTGLTVETLLARLGV